MPLGVRTPRSKPALDLCVLTLFIRYLFSQQFHKVLLFPHEQTEAQRDCQYFLPCK